MLQAEHGEAVPHGDRHHILPELGKLPLAAVGREHVPEMHYKLCGVPAMANIAVATLSRMFNQAEA